MHYKFLSLLWVHIEWLITYVHLPRCCIKQVLLISGYVGAFSANSVLTWEPSQVMKHEFNGKCGRGSISGGVRNFNFCPGIGCVFCPVLSPTETLTLCWPHIQGRPALVYMSSVLVQSLLLLLSGIWVVSPGGACPRLGRVNKRRRRS